MSIYYEDGMFLHLDTDVRALKSPVLFLHDNEKYTIVVQPLEISIIDRQHEAVIKTLTNHFGNLVKVRSMPETPEIIYFIGLDNKNGYCNPYNIDTQKYTGNINSIYKGTPVRYRYQELFLSKNPFPKSIANDLLYTASFINKDTLLYLNKKKERFEYYDINNPNIKYNKIAPNMVQLLQLYTTTNYNFRVLPGQMLPEIETGGIILASLPEAINIKQLAHSSDPIFNI